MLLIHSSHNLQLAWEYPFYSLYFYVHDCTSFILPPHLYSVVTGALKGSLLSYYGEDKWLQQPLTLPIHCIYVMQLYEPKSEPFMHSIHILSKHRVIKCCIDTCNSDDYYTVILTSIQAVHKPLPVFLLFSLLLPVSCSLTHTNRHTCTHTHTAMNVIVKSYCQALSPPLPSPRNRHLVHNLTYLTWFLALCLLGGCWDRFFCNFWEGRECMLPKNYRSVGWIYFLRVCVCVWVRERHKGAMWVFTQRNGSLHVRNVTLESTSVWVSYCDGSSRQ